MRHQTLSFIKSGLRIAGYLGFLALLYVPADTFIAGWQFTAVALISSELVGIMEEIGHD